MGPRRIANCVSYPGDCRRSRQIAQLAMRKVGEFDNFKCVLDTEGKIGPTWKECH
ncbi:DNA polymerase [Enterobacter phage 01_vB_Eclo_IJM]|nr:DNA polymerase [Enterobacter phage 01_vB_Eclo_IJM]